MIIRHRRARPGAKVASRRPHRAPRLTVNVPDIFRGGLTMTKMVYGLAAFGVTVALIGAGTVLTRPSPATPTVEASWVSSSGSVALPETVAPEATRALNQM